MNGAGKKRFLVAVAALSTYACGSSEVPEPQHTAFSDQPKLNYPRSQDTPESFVVPRQPRPRATRGTTRPRPESPPARRASPVGGDVWERLARCESSDGRDSASGKYHGFFQFSIATWRSVGGVGDPHEFSYAEQKEKAMVLQARSGWGQWPSCSRRLGLR